MNTTRRVANFLVQFLFHFLHYAVMADDQRVSIELFKCLSVPFTNSCQYNKKLKIFEKFKTRLLRNRQQSLINVTIRVNQLKAFCIFVIWCEACAYVAYGAALHNGNKHSLYNDKSLVSMLTPPFLVSAASITAMDLTNIESQPDVTDFIATSSVKSAITGYKHLQSDTKHSTGCPSTTSSHCLRCNVEGCIKCPVFLITDTRQCVERCPSGYIDQWSAHTEFMGRICIATGHSGALMAALAGMFSGFLVCLTVLGVAVMVIKRRRQRKTTLKQKLINESSMDRSDFLKQLSEMRPNAEYFLSMLNDTRRQIRKLYLSGDVRAANSYRPIVRDLARILILLNRPIELIPGAPSDWNRLYNWSEQILERYRPQMGQLIDLFQTPGHMGVDVDEFDATSVYCQAPGGGGFYKQSTIQPVTNGALAVNTKSQKMHLFGSLISLHEFEEPRSSHPFGSNFNTLKNGNLITDLNASSLWLEDEFYKLGFRPQDEITTEL